MPNNGPSKYALCNRRTKYASAPTPGIKSLVLERPKEYTRQSQRLIFYFYFFMIPGLTCKKYTKTHGTGETGLSTMAVSNVIGIVARGCIIWCAVIIQ